MLDHILSQNTSQNQASKSSDSFQNSSVLQFEEHKTKFDVQILSNSLVVKIGDYLAARVLQQLHYWNTKGYGVILKGVRWIYKPIREWLSESIVGFSKHQIQKAIAFLVQEGYVRREQLYSLHHGSQYSYAAQNRTYYYAINYNKLAKDEVAGDVSKTAQTTRAFGFPLSDQSDFQSVANLISPLSENNTKNTSIENKSRSNTLPQPPLEKIEGEEKKEKPSDRDISTSFNKHTSPSQPKPRSRAEVVKSKKRNSSPGVVQESHETLRVEEKVNILKGPWDSIEQRDDFYLELLEALPRVANARIPEAVAKKILADLEAGNPHSYWDDFINERPIGHSTKKPWDVAPGEVNEIFINFLVERMKRNGADTNEKAVNDVFFVLNDYKQASYFWEEFKRIFVLRADEMRSQQELGVTHANSPVWMRQRIKPGIEELERASEIVASTEYQLQQARKVAAQNRLSPGNASLTQERLSGKEPVELTEQEAVDREYDHHPLPSSLSHMAEALRERWRKKSEQG